mgnify:CR=1 FL=1
MTTIGEYLVYPKGMVTTPIYGTDWIYIHSTYVAYATPIQYQYTYKAFYIL